MYKSTSEPTP